MDIVTKLREALTKTSINRDYEAVFSTPQGKAVLADICKMGYVGHSTFAPLCREKTLLNEGARVLALAILRKVKIQPQLVIENQLDDKNQT